MPIEPRPKPESGRPAAERQLASAAPVRQFVDREEPIAIFQAAFKALPCTKPLVLVFHGGAGTGKSRLRRELTRLVDSRQKAVDREVITATLDFDVPVHRQPDAALLFLRKAIGEACKTGFPSFDLAFAVLWQKTHPETPLRGKSGTVPRSACVELGAGQSPFSGDSGHVPDEVQPLLEPGSLISQLLDESGKLPLIGLVPRISALVSERPKTEDGRLGTEGRDSPTSYLLPPNYYATWWRARGERELEDLPQMEPAAIVEQLPKLWASDLKEFIANRSSLIASRKAVLFVDSYEKLWGTTDEGPGTRDEGQKTDAWVREMVKQLPEVLWVISGRQKLRWEEAEKEWGDVLSQHEIGALPEHSARQFLSACGITDEPIQDAIAKGSQGLPHYLNLAADTFLEIKQSGQRVPSTSASSSTSRAETPEELFAQFVRHLDQPEIATLQILSASRFWNYGLFEHLVTEYQTGYPLTAYDDLSRFSFVGEGAAPETRTMHDLMREALQEHQAPELRKRVHLFLHELYAKQLEGLDVKNITDRHKAALTEAFYHGRQAKSAAELQPWFAAAYLAFNKARQHRLVTPLYREMVQALETELGPNHPDTATALWRLATELTNLAEYAEAEPLFRRALAIAETVHRPEHPYYLWILAYYGVLLRATGRYDEAEALCRRMAGELENEPGRDAYTRATVLGGMAVTLMHRGKYAEAEELLRRQVAICENEMAPDSGWRIGVTNGFGSLLLIQARYSEAEPLFRRGLAMSEKYLGANHPDFVAKLWYLAATLLGLGRYPEAEPLLQRALRLHEEVSGHPATSANIMCTLGALLREQGRYAEAEPLLRRALAVLEKKWGLDHHPETVAKASNLVSVLVRRGNHAEAEPMVLSAIATGEKKLGPNHPDTAHALHTAGVLYSVQGRFTEAEGYLGRAVDNRTRALGPEHQDTLESRDALALLEERQSRYAEAETLYRDVLEKRERVQGPDHPDVAATASRLAGICSRDGRYAEAEALYRRALTIREKVFGPDHPFTAETLDGLAKVCEQTGRAAEAQELAERAKRIRAQAAGEKTVDSR